MKKSMTSMALAAWLLVACADGGSEPTGNVAGSGAEACAAVSETGNGDAGSSHPIAVQLTGLPSDLSCDTRVRSIVFGYDDFVADVSATALLNVVSPVPANGEFTLWLDQSDFARIEFQSGAPDALGYYVVLFVDVDGNEIECTPDLSQDFSASTFVFYDERDAGVSHVVPLHDNTDTC